MLNKKFKLTKYLFLTGLLFNFFVYSANSTLLPVVNISSLRIELLHEKVYQTSLSSWNYNQSKIKTTPHCILKCFNNESLASQNRLYKTKQAVQDIISLKVNKLICPLRSTPRRFSDKHPLQFIG